MLKDINEVLKRLKDVKLVEAFNGDRILRDIVNLLARQLERDETGDVTHKEFDRVMKINTGPVNVMLMSALEHYAGIQVGGIESADREEVMRDVPELPAKDFEPKPELDVGVSDEDFEEIPKREVPPKSFRRKGHRTPPEREMPRKDEVA